MRAPLKTALASWAPSINIIIIIIFIIIIIRNAWKILPVISLLTVPLRRKNLYIPPLSKRVVSLGLHGLLAMRGERRSRALRAKCRVRLVAWLIKRLLCRLRNLLKHVKRT